MNILLISPERDILTSYKRLLEIRGADVTTAFDGIQAVSRITDTSPDFAFLDVKIPRVEEARILKLLSEKEIPSAVFLYRRPEAKDFRAKTLPETFLAYPFHPEELYEKMEKVLQLKREGQDFEFGDQTLQEKKFLLGNLRITLEETEVLTGILKNTEISGIPHLRTFVNALNGKLRELGSGYEIRYLAEEGYKLLQVS